jgi:hypothetical protein
MMQDGHPRLLFLAIATAVLIAALCQQLGRHEDRRCFANSRNFYECFGPYGTGKPK